MKKKGLLIYLLLLSFGFQVQAQRNMTLKECVEYSLQNHLSNTVYNNEIEIAKQSL
ncbi:hypothetical protein ACFFJX_03230 [Pseudarcicella hirudinis]|uniref:hypothetical protein n=1 Tax=Pseudarcicella hirudinis TaxID=1079859 RepID=UPI0035E51BCA